MTNMLLISCQEQIGKRENLDQMLNYSITRSLKPQPAAIKPSTKSSNYDPDVVHECQLPSAEEPHKLCLRRFSRKYELIRHQETVHSKKKSFSSAMFVSNRIQVLVQESSPDTILWQSILELIIKFQEKKRKLKLPIQETCRSC